MRSFIPFPAKDTQIQRKGIYLLPNLFTLTSLLLGFYSILSTIEGEFERSSWAILLGAIFDFLDGMVARATKTQSQFGQELDSLVDGVTFGVAPGLLIYEWALTPFEKIGFSAGFFYVASTLVRLARFNVQAREEERVTFRGLPSPGGGGIISATILFYYYLGGEGYPARHILFLILCYGTAFLMISTIPYPSSKALHLDRVLSSPFLLLLIGFISILAVAPIPTLFLATFLYAISGPASLSLRLFRAIPNKVQSYMKRRAHP